MIRLHLIPLLPLLGAAFCILGARIWRRQTVHFIACGAVLAAAVVTAQAWYELLQNGELRDHAYTWIAAGSFRVEISFLFDRLSGSLCAVVTGVGFLIHIYSMGYMHDDPSYARYFGYLNLFCGSMLILVLADSLPLLFVGWEGVGACSYLLIGFWYDKVENAEAGKKAFLTNRVGDAAFLLGMFALFATTGALDFTGLEGAKDAIAQAQWLGYPMAGCAALLLFIGATGKSAQIPLFVWLPDAMAGPTPVSALIHAATMVTAGVYLVARMAWLFAMEPVVLDIVAWTGAATALFAATIGFAQTDIKRVLAYSTISQLGFMFVGTAAGIARDGIPEPGLFHLITHAFFKACLFLGAGAVIHAMSGRQELPGMGGLRKPLPLTHATFLVATLAIAGVPPLSGFFSKDMVLEAALHHQPALFAVLLLAAACTAFYMTRLYCLAFTGVSRADLHTQQHLHEAPGSMTTVLVLLAIAATIAGLIHPHLELGVALRSTGAAALGIALAVGLYWGGERPITRTIVSGIAPLYRLVRNKYLIDELYRAIIVVPLRAIAFVLHRVLDSALIDGLGVHAGSWIAQGLGWGARRLQNGDAQRYATIFLLGAAILLWLAGNH